MDCYSDSPYLIHAQQMHTLSVQDSSTTSLCSASVTRSLAQLRLSVSHHSYLLLTRTRITILLLYKTELIVHTYSPGNAIVLIVGPSEFMEPDEGPLNGTNEGYCYG